MFNVGLADQRDGRAGFGVKVRFHRRQRHRLMFGNQLAVRVARREQLKD